VTATLTADGAVNVPGNPPQIITRALTVNFTQAASVGGQDATVDVVVTPLNNGATDAATTTIVGGPQSAVVDLTASPNPQVVFYLVPSNYPGLATPVNYRIAWRQGVLSRTYTTDFAMPDADTNFAALANLGDVIDGTAYLQQSDLGVAGRVARLNAQGQVMDADGNAISMASIDAVTGLINTEIANRQAADQSLQTNFTNQLSAQQTTVESYAQTQASQAAGAVQALLTTETSNREAADTTLQNQINTNSGKIAANVTALAGKASLTGGVVPASELPARPTEHTVATVAALTGLTTALQGDLAVVTGTGTYMLVATDPTQAANWVLVSPVASVAGEDRRGDADGHRCGRGGLGQRRHADERRGHAVSREHRRAERQRPGDAHCLAEHAQHPAGGVRHADRRGADLQRDSAADPLEPHRLDGGHRRLRHPGGRQGPGGSAPHHRRRQHPLDRHGELGDGEPGEGQRPRR
jgi:hypothetical protein